MSTEEPMTVEKATMILLAASKAIDEFKAKKKPLPSLANWDMPLLPTILAAVGGASLLVDCMNLVEKTGTEEEKMVVRPAIANIFEAVEAGKRKLKKRR